MLLYCNLNILYILGKPPPDEVDILRNQIILLHNQLIFERHRKDVHSERIRRILGRAKKSKMQEELIVALVGFHLSIFALLN